MEIALGKSIDLEFVKDGEVKSFFFSVSLNCLLTDIALPVLSVVENGISLQTEKRSRKKIRKTTLE